MHLNPCARIAAVLAVALGVLAHGPVQAAITDLDTWTLVEDPAHPNFDGMATATEIILSATGGPIPAARDIGFQSVDGSTPATSTSGYAFSPLLSFAIAIDFGLSFNTPSGQLGIGFGIGEDIDGEDSAGVALLINNGTPSIVFGAAARVNDVTQAGLIPVSGSLSGSMFVDYDASTGNVRLGASQSMGAAAPAGTATFNGIQNLWPGGDLLVSVFLRSDGTLASPWQTGEAAATFSNLRVLSGSASPVPAPAPLALLLPALAGLVPFSGRWRRAGTQPR